MNLYRTRIDMQSERELDRLYTAAESAVKAAERAEKHAKLLMSYAERQRAAADNLAAQIEAKYKALSALS